MALLLVTATYEELQHLIPSHTLNKTNEQDIHPFKLPILHHGKEVFCTITGVGPINAALSTGYAIAQLSASHIPVDFVLNVGLAGAYDLSRTPLRTLCLVSEEIYPEYGLHDGHSVVARAFKWSQWDNAPCGAVYDRIPLSDLHYFSPSTKKVEALFTVCQSLTVAGVSASFERVQTLWDTYHAHLENMEGFSVAFTAMRANIPCAEIRCVSNKIGPRRAEEKDFPGSLQKLGDILPTLNLI